MKCPRCAREMRKGYLHNTNQPVQWIPEGSKPSIFKTGVADGAVVLGENSFWTGYRADAWYCPACKMIIIPTGEQA